MTPGVAVASGIAQGKARRGVLRLQRFAQLEEAARVFREFLETGRLHLADAVNERGARCAERNGDPLVAGHAVSPAHVVPAAVLGAEVVGDVGHIEQLVRVEVRVVEEPVDDVRTRADVGRHRRLRTHVLEPLVVDAHIDSGLCGKALDVFVESVFVALDKALPLQYAQLGALFGLPDRRGRFALRLREQRHAARGAGRKSG